MQGSQLSGMKVAIIVSDDFEQVEMTEPRKAFEEAGAKTILISVKPGKVKGINHDQIGDSFPVDQTLDQAKPDDFDALLLPGGALNADFIRLSPQAQAFVKAFANDQKPIAVICHAPWLLISAGLVKGRTLTSFHTIQDDIRNAGGNWVDQEVVEDGNLLSSRQPDDIPAFSQAAIALFMRSKATA